MMGPMSVEEAEAGDTAVEVEEARNRMELSVWRLLLHALFSCSCDAGAKESRFMAVWREFIGIYLILVRVMY